MKIKFRILDVIYICIVLNLIPMALLGLFNISSKIYTSLYALVYIIQTILLFLNLHLNIKKVPKKLLILFGFIIINSFITLLGSALKFEKIDYNEILFIISSLVNILFLIIGVYRKKITLNELTDFLNKFCFIGIISTIINALLNYKSIFNLSTITNSYNANFSSFFPNRNQFGLFMLLMIIALSFLINIKYEKKQIFYYIIFVVNLILSMSRNSILGFVVFEYMLFYYKYIKEGMKTTVIKYLLYFIIIITLLVIAYLCISSDKFNQIINTLFLRVDTIESGSGRFEVWKNGIFIVLHNSLLFGVGRYKGIELNKKLFDSNLEYFHSMYIEKFVTHGLVGICILLLLLKMVWIKVNSVNNEINKIILRSELITFWTVSLFETTTRFSIGYADFMFLIFFFTIPILISNIEEYD